MIWIWIAFLLFVLAMLALDLGVFHRKAHVVQLREALAWSTIWIALSLAFSIFVYFGYENHWLGLGNAVDAVDGQINHGRGALLKYLTGYVVEKSLSVDNIFVIAMLFSFMAVPARLQHRVLFWGILGALIMRGAMIGAGAALIARFHWILYVFGGLLLLTAVKMLTISSGHSDPNSSWIMRLTRRIFRVTDDFHEDHFIVRDDRGRRLLTPLALSLVMIETTDVIFAVDSIPAIFAITADPFLVFTSNVFAILGLRSLYFALAGAIEKFRYLKLALAAVLAVVGAKMLASSWLKSVLGEHFNVYLLVVVMSLLALGVIASIISNRRRAAHETSPGEERQPVSAAQAVDSGRRPV
jgi:tellurite resistance protein TerC